MSLRDISPFHGESPLSGEPLLPLSLLWRTCGHGTPCPYKTNSIIISRHRYRMFHVKHFASRKISVENVPPERFQDHSTATGTQGGAVLFAPPSKSYRFSHPPSTCAKSMAQGISPSADGDLEGTCPLRESVLHLGACRLRRQIFREMKGKTEEILCGFPSIFLKYLGKDASKMRSNRCKTGSKTSPTALSWISLTDSTISYLFVSAQCFL